MIVKCKCYLPTLVGEEVKFTNYRVYKVVCLECHKLWKWMHPRDFKTMEIPRYAETYDTIYDERGEDDLSDYERWWGEKL